MQEVTKATPIDDLTAFQRDLLATVADVGPEYGLAIKDTLERTLEREINHGQLYPNLDDLVDAGLVKKRARDRRTNEYALTTEGKGELRIYQDWLTQCLEGDDV